MPLLPPPCLKSPSAALECNTHKLPATRNLDQTWRLSSHDGRTSCHHMERWSWAPVALQRSGPASGGSFGEVLQTGQRRGDPACALHGAAAETPRVGLRAPKCRWDKWNTNNACCCCWPTLVYFYSFMGLMPTYMENDGVLCTKLVCFYDRESGSSLPATHATVVLLDPECGNVKAVSKTNACTD